MGPQIGASEPQRDDEEQAEPGRRWHTADSAGPDGGFSGTTWRRPARWKWTDLRRLLGFGVMRASSPLRNTTRAGEPVYARARLESVKIAEHYSYYQEISRNSDGRLLGQPDGLITLVLPYDGYQYFTRQAYDDVMRAYRSGADPAASTLVGYLALADFEHTDLDNLIGADSAHSSVPIRVPLCLQPGSFAASLLTADDRTCLLSHKYRPSTQHFEVNPVAVDVRLDDPDTAEFSPPIEPGDFARQKLRIMRHVDFRPGLQLQITVRLEIPSTMADGIHPEVKEVLVNWPTHTSLRSLSLDVGGEKRPLHYDPKRTGLTWSGVPMARIPEYASGEISTFQSPEMCLSIPQPGELYHAEQLNGTASVKVDRLLSGMQARLFDATGSSRGHPRPELESSISARFSFVLDDAFARRRLSVFHQLHFDEVIPDERRIDDIKTALRSLGFTVNDRRRSSGADNCWLDAERTEGPDIMQLSVHVVGRRHKAHRERHIPGGMTYKTELDSGELSIYLHGSLPRDSQPMVQQINALQQALHERFARLPARR